jgi:hypothetical protein
MPEDMKPPLSSICILCQEPAEQAFFHGHPVVQGTAQQTNADHVNPSLIGHEKLLSAIYVPGTGYAISHAGLSLALMSAGKERADMREKAGGRKELQGGPMRIINSPDVGIDIFRT